MADQVRYMMYRDTKEACKKKDFGIRRVKTWRLRDKVNNSWSGGHGLESRLGFFSAGWPYIGSKDVNYHIFLTSYELLFVLFFYLEKSRVGLVFLDDGQDGADAQDDAEDQVEADEELVQLAIAGAAQNKKANLKKNPGNVVPFKKNDNLTYVIPV